MILLKEGAGRFTIYSNTERFNELVAYIHQRIPNLDEVEANEEHQRLFCYSTEGYTTQEQAKRLKKVKRVATLLNTASLAVSLPLVFIPIYNVWILGLCTILPLLGYILYAGSGGLVNPFSENNKSPLASLKSTLMLPPAALAMRCMSDYTILSFANYWICTSAFCLIILVLAFYRQANNSGGRAIRDRITSALLLLFVLVYVSSATIISNIVLNAENTKRIEARIINRWKIETSTTAEYYVQIEKRGELQLSQPIKVSGRVYKRLSNSLVVSYNGGLLGIPVFWIEM
ncbi:hypothetical protein [uncultured Acetobacteroides sp.]|uniref:hypothetical protein n=1 Tax=uncultured Acetobacteroides sp. TaxID=1760811 RepID=UPI0029F53D82|nr:hypothetical protein [uncultured Acetobacteroides sp.]